MIYQLQRDGAETRAALRKALENAPKQIEQGSAPGAQDRAQHSAAGHHSPKDTNGPRIAPQREETGLSYGDIADWLEKELNQ